MAYFRCQTKQSEVNSEGVVLVEKKMWVSIGTIQKLLLRNEPHILRATVRNMTVLILSITESFLTQIRTRQAVTNLYQEVCFKYMQNYYSLRRTLGLISNQSVWNLSWTDWHCKKFCFLSTRILLCQFRSSMLLNNISSIYH